MTLVHLLCLHSSARQPYPCPAGWKRLYLLELQKTLTCPVHLSLLALKGLEIWYPALAGLAWVLTWRTQQAQQRLARHVKTQQTVCPGSACLGLMGAQEPDQPWALRYHDVPAELTSLQVGLQHEQPQAHFVKHCLAGRHGERAATGLAQPWCLPYFEMQLPLTWLVLRPSPHSLAGLWPLVPQMHVWQKVSGHALVQQVSHALPACLCCCASSAAQLQARGV